MINKLVLGPGPGWLEQRNRDLDNGKISVGVDIIPEFCPDIVADITEGIPEQIERGVFDEIEAYHVFEHIEMNKDFKKVMWDCFNVLKPGGTLDICVPHKDGLAAYQCYEHTRFFVEDSFMNFYSNPFAKEMNLPVFEKVLVEKRPKDGDFEVHVILRKPIV